MLSHRRGSSSPRRRTVRASVLVFSAGAVACGDDASVGPTLEPDPTAVARVVLTPDSGSVAVGGSFRFEASALNVSGQALVTRMSWTVTDPSVATVDSTGLVTGVGSGSTLLVARADARADTSAVTVTATSAERFDLRVVLPDDPLPQALTNALEAARSRWESLVTGDLPDVAGPIDGCGPFHPADTASVDDLVVWVTVEELDGAYGVLGAAAPCLLRESGLPITAAIIIDEGDIPLLTNLDQLDEFILHEMGHALGVGSLWEEFGLRGSTCSNDPFFDGAGAIAAFNAAGGAGYGGRKVPIHEGARSGSNCTHWRESVLQHELLTPILQDGQQNPLSAVTARSLEDMGYQVDAAQTDRYSISVGQPASSSTPRPGLAVGNDVLPTSRRVFPVRR